MINIICDIKKKKHNRTVLGFQPVTAVLSRRVRTWLLYFPSQYDKMAGQSLTLEFFGKFHFVLGISRLLHIPCVMFFS